MVNDSMYAPASLTLRYAKLAETLRVAATEQMRDIGWVTPETTAAVQAVALMILATKPH